MFDTVAQLLEQIRLGEDSSLELKTIVFAGDKVKGTDRQGVADELAAFANAHGGVLWIPTTWAASCSSAARLA